MKERYFIIRNDVSNYYNISERDSPETRSYKETLRARNFAVFDYGRNQWIFEFPHWFWNSENENKSITIESFQYYKPDGTSDIGTTLHSETLIDGNYSQFDNMIGLSAINLNRTFTIANKPQFLEFYFKDYLSNERLGETEIVTIQKTNDNGDLLYYDKDGNETTESFSKTESTYKNNNAVMIDIERPVSFIIMARIIC